MKLNLIPRLGLGTCVLLAAPVLLAGEGKGQNGPAAPAAQIYIDEATGLKTGPSDSDAGIKPASNYLPASRLVKSNPVMPAQSQAPVEHAKGMLSATLGEEHLQYLVMTIENGKRVYKHVSNTQDHAATEVHREEQ